MPVDVIKAWAKEGGRNTHTAATTEAWVIDLADLVQADIEELNQIICRYLALDGDCRRCLHGMACALAALSEAA